MPRQELDQAREVLDPVGAVGLRVAGEPVDQDGGDADRAGGGHVVGRLVADVHGRRRVGPGLGQGGLEDARVANRWSIPWRARMSASQGSKLDTTPRVTPRPASSSRAGRTSSNSW